MDDVPQFVLTTVADTSDGCTHVCSNARTLCKNSAFGGGGKVMCATVSAVIDCAGWRAGDVVPARSVTGNFVVDFDYLSVGESGPPGAQGLSEGAGLRYISFMDNLNNLMSLKPVEVCTDDTTAASVLL